MGFPDPAQLAEQQQQINRQMQRRPKQRSGCLILFISLALFLLLVAGIVYVAFNILQPFP
jgi:flagellar basal body-associated protein FliL